MFIIIRVYILEFEMKFFFNKLFNVITEENHVRATFVRDGWFLQVTKKKKKFESLIE